MCEQKKEQNVSEVELDELEQVTGGGAFDNIPRVPEHKLDDNLKSKI